MKMKCLCEFEQCSIGNMEPLKAINSQKKNVTCDHNADNAFERCETNDKEIAAVAQVREVDILS